MRSAFLLCGVALLGLSACATSPSAPYRAERFAEDRHEQQVRRELAHRDHALSERDALITSQIRAQFASDPYVDARDIDVDTYLGTVARPVGTGLQVRRAP